ncbi:MAG TPA: diguanylate cyclase, partial [Xanthomonadales bacterium]|nr:diguanylate cyclase [Xanthomonadales bacterium]
WVGTYDDGLFRIAGEDVTHWNEADGLPGGWVTSTLEDAQGTIWVTTAPGGVSRLRDGRFDLLARREGLPSDSVRTLASDREGSLWIGTNAGLARLKDLKFVTLSRRNGLPEDQVRCVLQTRDGALWLGTYGGGLVRWRDGRFTPFGNPDGWNDAYIRTLMEARDGTLWIGTQTGLNRIVDGRHESMNGRDGLVGTKVDAIAELADGTMLVNTETGGLQARPPGGTYAPFIPEAAQALHGARVIVQGDDGHVWLGTSESGLFEVDGRHIVRRFRQVDGLPDDAVLAIHRDADGTLWLGTHKGLARLRDGKVARFPAGRGLDEDPVFQVLDDRRGTFWLTSPHALVAMPRAEVEAVLDGRETRVSVKRYGRDDGLGSDLGSGGTQPAGTVLADGTLAIPTVGGLALVDPSDLHVNTVPPTTVLTDVLVDGRAVPRDAATTPPWSSQRFEFRFDGLSLLVPEAVGFRYRLMGFDPAWIDAGGARSAHYTTLPAGHYVFRVQARNNDGVWSTRAAEHELTLAAPPWLRWWALAIYTIAGVLAVFALVRWRERALVAHNLLLETSVKARTAELSDSNQRLLETTDQLAAANARLEQLAITDGLTGLANRRRFDDVLAQEWARARRTGQPLALLMIDVDHFKKFNDAYGHPEGDECLRAVAGALRGATRRTDTPARYGGEEFAVVCPDTNAEQAFVLARHVLAAVHALRLAHAASPVAPHVTVSIGIATSGTACPDPEALLAAADAALYEAKRGGRDRAHGAGIDLQAHSH